MSGPRTLIDGRYELEELLGQGGMGRVHAATDRRLGRRVAIKLLRPGRLPERAARRLEREAILAARVHHPNVVAIHDAGHHEGSPYVVMELVDGESAADLLARRGPLSGPEVVDVGAQALDGLAALHGVGLVHRDVTPANLLLSDGRVKLADLGIAREVGDDGLDLTRPGDLLGTAAYLAPERAAGAAASERSDLYAVGAVLYELLSGRPPHQRGDVGATALAHLLDDPTPLADVAPDVPAGVARVVEGLLARDPDDRPGDAAEAAALLRGAAALDPARTATTRLPVAPAWPEEPTAPLPAAGPDVESTPGRRRSVLVVLAAVVLVAAVGIGLAAFADRGTGTDVAAGGDGAVVDPPATTTTVEVTTTTVATTTSALTTTVATSTTAAPTTTQAGLPDDLDGLVELVEEDPSAWGQRGRVLLDKLEDRDEFDRRDYDRLLRDVERWLERDRIDPELGEALLEVLRIERQRADDD